MSQNQALLEKWKQDDAQTQRIISHESAECICGDVDGVKDTPSGHAAFCPGHAAYLRAQREIKLQALMSRHKWLHKRLVERYGKEHVEIQADFSATRLNMSVRGIVLPVETDYTFSEDGMPQPLDEKFVFPEDEKWFEGLVGWLDDKIEKGKEE